MNIDKTKEKLNNQLQENIVQLDEIRNLYEQKMTMYGKCLSNIKVILESSSVSETEYLLELLQKTEKSLSVFEEQISKIYEQKNQLQKLQVELIKNMELFDENEKKQAKITYFGKLYQDGAQEIKITYGYGSNWTQTETKVMGKTDKGFVLKLELEQFDSLNFCFCNENDVWDNNDGKDYSILLMAKKLNIIEKNIFSIQLEQRKNTMKEKISACCLEAKQLKMNYMNRSIYEENVMLDYVETQIELLEQKKKDEQNGIADNGTLLISEIQDQVILPYTGQEVEKLMQNGLYESVQEAIEANFIRPLSDYKDLARARVRETYKLLTEREDYTILDVASLALELLTKRYLHPAIISACKNLDELDVYLDCLDKNELDDFKIFEIKYEIYPTVVKENKIDIKINLWQKFLIFFEKLFSEKKKKEQKNNEI